MLSTQISRQAQSLRFVQSNGPRIHVERYESGSPTALLLHGGGDGAFIWDLFAPTLAERFTTVAVDLRGHGNSGWDRTNRYDLEGYVSDIVHVIDRAISDELIIIGHSLGAHLAIHLYERFASRVRACVLVDYAPELIPEGIQQATTLLRNSLRFYPSVDRYVDWLKSTRHLTEHGALERVAARAIRRVGDGFRLKVDPACVDAFPHFTPDEARILWSLLGKQACPTLVVRGAGSAVLSPAVAKQVTEVLPQGELATVSAAGHAVMLDNPAEFARLVLEFLERVLPACQTPVTSEESCSRYTPTPQSRS